jgi:hypothetical protein
MSWHFSQALVEEYSAGTSLAGEQSAPSNMSHTPLLYCANARTIKFCQRSRFGMTYARLTESHGEELLTSYLAAFPVRTSVQQVAGKEYQAKSPDYGLKCQESFAKYDQNLSLWKIPPYLQGAELIRFSGTWPRWGLMRNGELWALQTLEQGIVGREYGFWPTPTHSPRDASCTMETALKWDGKTQQTSLSFAVAREEMKADRHIPNGTLNPPWVEWLMGWPIGWTDLKPLAMDKFLEWQHQHSKFY